MNLKYIDIHSHLNLPPLLENKEAILVKMREMNIGTITVGTDMDTSKMAIEIAEQNPDLCWATVGFHPADGFIPDDSDWTELEQLAQNTKVVAIGETGLDYFRDQSTETKNKQTEIFKKHIELAMRVNKPLMLHVRASKGSDDAYYNALEILKEVGYQRKANFHFFSGSQKCMQDIIAVGYTISVDGPITFSHDYDEMIKACPIDKIMIETDAPFAAPAPHRGKTCEPWMVVEVAKKIAELKGIDLEIVRVQMIGNTKSFFNI
jgi:TatD DNase family protein